MASHGVLGVPRGPGRGLMRERTTCPREGRCGGGRGRESIHTVTARVATTIPLHRTYNPSPSPEPRSCPFNPFPLGSSPPPPVFSVGSGGRECTVCLPACRESDRNRDGIPASPATSVRANFSPQSWRARSRVSPDVGQSLLASSAANGGTPPKSNERLG